MQDAKAIASAPRSTIIFALVAARFPGQPPHEVYPTISQGPRSLNAKVPSAATLKSVVPGHMSSVCMHLMIPTFTAILLASLAKRSFTYVWGFFTSPDLRTYFHSSSIRRTDRRISSLNAAANFRRYMCWPKFAAPGRSVAPA